MFAYFHGYKVYDDGVVYSLKTKRTGYIRKIMSQVVNDKGYRSVQLIINGKQRMIKVHRLLAHLWMDLDLTSDLQVHHKDFNPSNNVLDNLEVIGAGEHNHITSMLNYPHDTDTEKECRKCHIVKSRSEFSVINSSKYEAHSSYCIMCIKSITRTPAAKSRRQERYNTRRK